MEVTYTKLSDLLDQEFTIEKMFPYKFKAWDNESRKMLMSETWKEGYRKIYTCDTDKGRLDLSASQVANILEAVCEDGRSDVNGRRFRVKGNGKTGMEIRYFFNPVKESSEVFEEELPAGW
jgi:hypothetical protein